MAFITIEDFKTHLKDYVIDAISDNDATILEEAIESATSTAAGYIGRFDVDLIFAATGEDRKKFADLITHIKDIAKWRFINLTNLLTNWDVAESNYKNAITELGKIQSGKVEPKDWPYPTTSTGNQNPFTISSRPKRGNYI
jgi:phage gp36-like protein